jgi:GNAT superfamily N-acetyltransferase
MANFSIERLSVVTFAERPDLLSKVFATEIQSAVPEFMRHDPIAMLYYGDGHLEHYREFGLAAINSNKPGEPLARAFSIPFAFRDGTAVRDELPDGGWDEIIRWGYLDRLAARRPTAVSALEIMVAPRLQGRGLSQLMLNAMRANTRRLGFTDLYAPVRPTEKARAPHARFSDHVVSCRPDGLPSDPWLRVHIRAGAEIVKVAPRSMVIAGTIADWRQWTGLNFSYSGEAVVPGALCPIHLSLEQDHGVYVEPNIWLRHRL